ncbi:Zinc finger protein 782 [Eumeta japonica]|uniref:Zinc finger protein 782 n=1 Tax=Eumeta variegata TaxID=151549 RepID=A0A4C1UES8_EUMVA|nr:Zinc finger protein 782 [Eumeta japonica]
MSASAVGRAGASRAMHDVVRVRVTNDATRRANVLGLNAAVAAVAGGDRPPPPPAAIRTGESRLTWSERDRDGAAHLSPRAARPATGPPPPNLTYKKAAYEHKQTEYMRLSVYRSLTFRSLANDQPVSPEAFTVSSDAIGRHGDIVGVRPPRVYRSQRATAGSRPRRGRGHAQEALWEIDPLISVVQGDGLPAYICQICESELSICYDFVMKCETADRSLRQLTSDLTAELFTDELQYKLEADIPHESEAFHDSQYAFEDSKHDDNEKPQCLNAHAIDLLESPLEVEPKSELEAYDDTQLGLDDVPAENGSFDLHDDLQKIFANSRKGRHKMHKKRRKRKSLGPIQCVVCGLMVNSRSAMEIHARTHTGEKPFSCPACEARYPSKGHLKRHYETYHTNRERKFTCETCGNSFYRKNDIIVHMRRHTGETPYACPCCPKKFQQITTLIRHKRTHTGDKPYSCPICAKAFADKSMVTKHMSVHSDEKKFSCHLCTKSLKSKSALRQHLKLHSNEKHNVCNFCGSAFAAKGNLKAHIRRVHSEKSGQCNICLKTFANLEAHMPKHTGEKPFTCETCRRSFITKRSLANHIVFKHQNIDKYKCTVSNCTKTFPAPSMLEYHFLKQHSNETPFVCQHCSRGFFRISDLSRHLRVSHMDLQVKPSKSPS